MRIGRDVLWSGTMLGASLSDRVDAAARNGYAALSVGPEDCVWARDAGPGIEHVRARAADQGVALSILDCAVEWYPHIPPSVPFSLVDFSVDDIFRFGGALEITHLSAVAPLATELSLPELAGRLARLCDRAHTEGWYVQFEFTPRSPVADIGTAWELVRLADRPNLGLVFDTWHFFRVDPDYETLSSVPGERILAVQVSDGASELTEGLVADTFRHRRLPGDGSFDLVRLLRALHDIGGLRRVGPEVLSVELAALGPAEAARLATEHLEAVAARTGI